jgi:hypothetical protein
MTLGAFMRGSMMLFIEKPHHIIGIIIFSNGVDFWPVEFALIGYAQLVISHSFSAFFLQVI